MEREGEEELDRLRLADIFVDRGNCHIIASSYHHRYIKGKANGPLSKTEVKYVEIIKD